MNEEKPQSAESWENLTQDHFELNDASVQVWRLSFAALRERWSDAESLLTTEELARAHQYQFAKDREQFTLTRAALRRLLASYLNREARGLVLEYNEYGKPSVKNGADLCFNVSHSGDCGLLAFARSPLGIDVERLERVRDVLAVAREVLAPEEFLRVAAQHPDSQNRFFLEYWTLKEALVKALGEGLSIPLREVKIILDVESRKPRLQDKTSAKLKGWRLKRLPSPAPDYVAGLAYRGTMQDFSWLNFPDPLWQS